jgi:ankyrin repeat protein
MLACAHAHLSTARDLIALGAHVNARVPFGNDLSLFSKNDGSSALMLACEAGHDKIVRLLLENDADVTYARRDGSTAISLAATHEPCVRALLDAVDTTTSE